MQGGTWSQIEAARKTSPSDVNGGTLILALGVLSILHPFGLFFDEFGLVYQVNVQW